MACVCGGALAALGGSGSQQALTREGLLDTRPPLPVCSRVGVGEPRRVRVYLPPHVVNGYCQNCLLGSEGRDVAAGRTRRHGICYLSWKKPVQSYLKFTMAVEQ